MSAEREAFLQSQMAAMVEITDTVIYSGLASVIFKATDRATKGNICVKVMLKKNMDADQEHALAKSEMELHASLPPHPNVVRIVASEDAPAAYLLATPYTPHGDLWELTRFGATFCERAVRNCATQMFAGLAHTHNSGIVHGDIKPHNFLLFMLDGKYVVKLCDFGLAERSSRPGGMLSWTGLRGTSGWFCPEIVSQLDHGFAGDLFPCGLILFRMLAGYAPFDPPTNFQPVEFEHVYWGHVSDASKDCIRALLEVDPARRITDEGLRSHPWLRGDPPPEPIAEQLKELCKFGPPPRTDVYFWGRDMLASGF
eukprot:TRINITY_DN11146_c0_g3_i1.p1 TRINITY_DN11146_c0_g3~~TRINITY_DN11146_c0_g3_i1.p1  ORF type:complete len:312 (-),score=58.92 TRINITY_DN11146_c0_g3_i1:206-1141(-)